MLKHCAVASAVLALAITGALAAPGDGLAPRKIPAQEIPVPTTVSPAMQKEMSEAAAFVFSGELPKTNAQWEAWSNPDPAATDRRIAELLAKLDLTLSEEMIAGVRCYVITPRKIDKANAKRLLVHIHGGGYVFGAGKGGATEAIQVAGESGIKTIAIDYRLAPDHPFPAPTDDAFAVWKAVTEANKGSAIGLFGTSAGGAMVLAVTQRAIAEGVPRPAAVVVGTPWSDLGETGDSYFTNRHLDAWNYPDILGEMARQYAPGRDFRDPRLSPVYGSFAGFPPTLLLSGTRDIFLSNSVRVDRKLRDAGRPTQLIVYEGQSHAGYFGELDDPETRIWLRDVARFWDERLGIR